MRLLLFFATMLSGCTVDVKTHNVPAFGALDDLSLDDTSRTDLEIAMGAPQSAGLHIVDADELTLLFYYGLMGELVVFPGRYARLDSGMAFASFEAEALAELLYFSSDFEGPKIQMGGPLPIADIASQLVLGETTLSELESLLGEPHYSGRRYSRRFDVEHELAFFDASVSKGDLVTERWLLVGYDPDKFIHDILWVSSHPDDLQSLDAVEPQRLRSLTRIDQSYPYAIASTESISTSTRIDPVQVSALISTQPQTVEEYVSVLGSPTARGFKAFKGEDGKLISHWSYMVTELKGSERHASMLPDRDGIVRDTTYAVMDIETTRLLVGHAPDGRVSEVMWLYPTTNHVPSN